MSKVTVHKIVIKVVDFEGSSAEDVAYAVSNNKYFPGSVLSHQTATTEWDGDDHPLNRRMTMDEFDAWMAANGGKEVPHG
ncbi:hypothetical protein [Azospirillum sp. TSO5]|uniref:hypothetical protein n=1 Tax=Azospirillum sp. TSO5 TaxID=716760 RepID=UPI000D60D767|nr:hypothetical protein [Azospirillum sp. TSO5]PWC96944.1 hypothetical protein TSO5_05800 [Azospirillum sp. TSO5]